MRIIGLGILDDFMRRHPDSQGPLRAWVATVRDANWERSTDIRMMSGSASFLGNRRVVFNIKGNKYRLGVKVAYQQQVVQIIQIGTHTEYNKWKW